MSRRLRRHQFVSDGSRDHRGDPVGCAACPLLWGNEVHQVEELPAEVFADQARRIGERI